MRTADTVSVIIPTYYRNERLAAALQSVSEQTYDPIETIVVDDSGESHAAELVEEYDWVQYIPLEENKGAQKAREVGFRKSSGEYIQFLDDDDELFPEKLTTQIPLFEDTEVGVVYSGLVLEDGPTVRPKVNVGGDVLEAALKFQTAPCMIGTMLIKREVVRELLPFRHTHGADDIGMKIELARITQFQYVDDILLHRGNTEGSLSTTQAAVDGRRQILETYSDLYDEYPPDVRRAAIAETHLMQGEYYINQYLWSTQSLIEFAKACYHIPGLPKPYIGSLAAAMLGRPGYRLSRRLYSRLILGSNRRGKMI